MGGVVGEGEAVAEGEGFAVALEDAADGVGAAGEAVDGVALAADPVGLAGGCSRGGAGEEELAGDLDFYSAGGLFGEEAVAQDAAELPGGGGVEGGEAEGLLLCVDDAEVFNSSHGVCSVLYHRANGDWMPMTAPLSHAERYALGVRARKQVARSAHGAFDAKACPAAPLEVLREAERGRVPRLLKIKQERMVASAFGFFRGAVPIMAADLACQPNTGITTQICGDAHVLNLGAYGGYDGRLVFDINDFDETIRGPFEWDVKRLATSLLLAGRAAGIRRSTRREAVELFTARYRRWMHEFAAMPVLEMVQYQIHRLAEMDPVASILKTAERSTPRKSLVKLTEPDVSGKAAKADAPPRRFRSEPPLLERVPAKEAESVLAALGPYARTLQPERRHFLELYRPVDVAFKVVGTGSVGLRDYCIYFEGAGHEAATDPLFLQVKEETASAYSAYLPEGSAGHTHEGHRVVDGQRAMQLTSDPFLGYTTIDGRDYLVRQLNDHKASLDIATLKPEGLLGYADLCGELLARGHARAGDPVEIAGYLGGSERFDRAVLEFARTYADKTERDWGLLKKMLKG